MAARLVAAGFRRKTCACWCRRAMRRRAISSHGCAAWLAEAAALAHLDVVEAHKEDWSPDLDPFKLIERDGYYYGRGTSDDKAMAAIFVANMIRYARKA